MILFKKVALFALYLPPYYRVFPADFVSVAWRSNQALLCRCNYFLGHR
jgi:hypothetical protein